MAKTKRKEGSKGPAAEAAEPVPADQADAATTPAVAEQPQTNDGSDSANDGGADSAGGGAGPEPGAVFETVADRQAHLRATYPALPALAAAVAAWRHKQPPAAVRIASKREGFRRAGMSHPKAATVHPLDRFRPDELEALFAEPMLTVEFVEAEE